MTREETEAKRGALLAELWKVGYRCPMPTAQGIAAHNALLDKIQRQLDALPQPETQVTGEAAGIIAIGNPFPVPPREPSAEELRRAEDPFYRFAVECGWENK